MAGTDRGSCVGIGVESAEGPNVGVLGGFNLGLGDGDCVGSAEGGDVGANDSFHVLLFLASILRRCRRLASRSDDEGTDFSILSRSMF